MKQASAARAAKQEKKFQRANSLQLLIDDFVDENQAEVMASTPDSDEEFWNNLPTAKHASFANLAEHPRTHGSKLGKQGRLQRLGY